MLERFRSFIIGLSVLVVLALVALYFLVTIGSGDDLFGERQGNLPQVDFAALNYGPDQNGYLACSPEFCSQAIPDGPAPVYEVPASTIRRILADFADSRPTVDVFRFDLPNNQFDFTERLPGQAFPGVLTIKIVSLDGFRSTVLFYSRQPVGDSEKRDHADRVTRWQLMLRDRLGLSD